MKIRIELEIDNTRHRLSADKIIAKIERLIDSRVFSDECGRRDIDVVSHSVSRDDKAPTIQIDTHTMRVEMHTIRGAALLIVQRLENASDALDKAVSEDERMIVETYMRLTVPLNRAPADQLAVRLEKVFPFWVSMYALMDVRNMPIRETVLCSGHNHKRIHKDVRAALDRLNMLTGSVNDSVSDDWVNVTGRPGPTCVCCGINTFGKKEL